MHELGHGIRVPWCFTDRVDAIGEAFAAIDRRGFLPAAERGMARHDGPLPIGHGQTNSQPRTVEDMLRLLELRRGQRVLDVGSGSGWTTALLAHLVGPDGRVVGVELEPDLVRFGRANLAATQQSWARIEQATRGVLGLPADAPYDRILVSADGRALPEQLTSQLADGGRMVIPVAGRMILAVRDLDRIVTTEHGMYSFVPLR
jgi:protein-L-isoaspartate(D-aspartate) O-methyltransferase